LFALPAAARDAAPVLKALDATPATELTDLPETVSGVPPCHEVGPGLDRLIMDLSKRHGVDPHLVKAIIRAESGFDPKAKSASGACGLMQLMPGTARRLGARNVFDPAQNLAAGVKYLDRLLERFGNVRAALAAYVKGPGAVLRCGGVPHDARHFVERILRYARAYRRAAEILAREAPPVE
jgi:soluble lytic murein transglycosylase-like protein